MTKKQRRPVEKVDGIWRINNSSLDLIQGCLKKADYIINHEFPDVETESKVFGTGIHAALQRFYLDHPGARTSTRTKDAFIESVSQSSITLPADSKGADKSARSIETAFKIIDNYFDKFGDDPFIVYEDDTGKWVEREFLVDVLPGIQLFGTVDLVLKHIDSSLIYVTDHKTTRTLSGFENRASPNHQLTGYIWALNRMGIQTSDAILQGLQVAKTTQGIYRVMTHRSGADFGEWMEWVTHNVKAWDYAKTTKTYPMAGGSVCHNYGGCAFLEICQAPINLREGLLKQKTNKGEEDDV